MDERGGRFLNEIYKICQVLGGDKMTLVVNVDVS